MTDTTNTASTTTEPAATAEPAPLRRTVRAWGDGEPVRRYARNDLDAIAVVSLAPAGMSYPEETQPGVRLVVWHTGEWFVEIMPDGINGDDTIRTVAHGLLRKGATSAEPGERVKPSEADELAALDSSELYARLHAVQAEIARRNEDGLPELIRAALVSVGYKRKHAAQAVAVEFPTWDWDNGNFYNPYEGHVTFPDDTYTVVDFSDTPVKDRLTELSGDAQPLGEKAGVRIDLRTGDVEHDDYLFAH